ncbi:MAG: hypothetical protein HYY41_02890 [Chloroflexi bacterium]|nr:hypothetical protein [Chloroflexota bacterium]
MRRLSKVTKTLVQCDFDGTITEEDVSFMLLDAFADGDWRRRLKEYEAGRISVGRFNTEAFSMVKAPEQYRHGGYRDICRQDTFLSRRARCPVYRA